MALFTKQEALDYHEFPRRGKVEVVPIKPCNNQKDLSMAYSPGDRSASMVRWRRVRAIRPSA